MANVEFNEGGETGGSVLYSRIQRSKKEPQMVAWMIKKGMAKSEAQANFILLAIAIVFLAIATFLFFRLSAGTYKNKILYKEDIPADQINNYPPGYIDQLPSRS